MRKVRFGVVGYGQRGSSMTKSILFKIDEIEVVAVCDEYLDRMEEAARDVKEKTGNHPFATQNYKELLAREEVEAVYVASSWESHVEVAIEAMKAGKAVACEVGGAYSIEELNELVKTQESTGMPFMFMENCCFNKTELLATSVARTGKLGKIVHCEGSYAHDLRKEVSSGNIIRHYRLRNYINRNSENYPTHELGPIAKLLNINRGNRMLSLVSIASGAFGLEEYIKNNPEITEGDPSLVGQRFKQGDIVDTIITCAGGETIHLRLDTTLPRFYSRNFTVRGTKGMYHQDTNTFFLDGMPEKHGINTVEYTKEFLDNGTEYEEYLPKEWRGMTPEEIKAGHGGMDIVEFRRFVECYLNGEEMPVDVYDAASWMAITALSERSIAMGGAPQAIPDFTNGKWMIRKPLDVVKFD